MFRVGVFSLIALILSLFFGCSDKTSDTESTGVEIGFRNCLTFNAQVSIDNNYVGSFSSERAWFIDVPVGSHSLEVHANLIVDAPGGGADSTFCWTRSFSVADRAITLVTLDCNIGGCPPIE